MKTLRNTIRSLYLFLPVQLLVLHFRKYQLLLLFWVILFSTISGHFAASFGAKSLFLSPEYLGNISWLSMFLLGGSSAVFVMAWHITTFIIHSKRVPFLGATTYAFLKYCINNSIIPLAFFVYYSYVSVRYQWSNEHFAADKIFLHQVLFYLGALLITLVSFAYFFRVDRDLIKTVFATIANPSPLKEIIPYDSLDYDYDLLRVETFLGGRFNLCKISDLQSYHPRFLYTVLRRHHRNALFAGLFSFVILLLLGINMDLLWLRIPAGAGFLLLFAVMMGVVGGVKYLLRSWEMLGWIVIIIIGSLLVSYNVFDLRSEAFGINYHADKNKRVAYNYETLSAITADEILEQDKQKELARLNKWLTNQQGTTTPPTLIVVNVSGGGSRSAYWCFRVLQYLDSCSRERVSHATVLLSGASGGMLGAAYWREIHDRSNPVSNLYDPKWQHNIGKDLLNPIIFSLVSNDLISPFDHVSIDGRRYKKDRGYAFEQQLQLNTRHFHNKRLSDYILAESEARIPMMVMSGTIVDDGRTLLSAVLPVSYLCRPGYSLKDTFQSPAIDAVELQRLLAREDAGNLFITSALRMNATFPIVLPAVKLPTQPEISIMDAGMRDNFGLVLSSRYLFTFKDWIKEHVDKVIVLSIRDTRENQMSAVNSGQTTLGSMLIDPVFSIQDKWQTFQSYNQSYLKEYMPEGLGDKLHFISLQYIPKSVENMAALNFHLTQRDKDDIEQSIYNPQNQNAVRYFLELIGSEGAEQH